VESRAALEVLCETYAGPIFAFVRRRVASREQAEDLTQEFFARLMDGRLLSRADADTGRFRSFLLHAVRDFVADAHDHGQAVRRGGGIKHSSLSVIETPEPLTHLSPDQEFEVQWARAVLVRSLDRLRSEYPGERAALCDVLQTRLDQDPAVSGRELATQLKMTEGAVRVAVFRMKQRLGQLIREEVAATVPANADVDDELLRLRSVLESSR
jgi:RNA polymerase sigma-70 factor (ECF subfamily)